MISKTTTVSALFLLSVSACGGGSDTDPEAAIAGPQQVDLVSTLGVQASYNEADDTITVDEFGALQRVLTPSADLSVARPVGFRVYDGSGGRIAYRGSTASGSGVTTIFGGDGSAPTGAFHERIGETTMPTSGSATYSVGYAGIIKSTVNNDIQFTVGGVATLDADFGAGEVSGLITERSTNTGSTLNDIQLGTTAIEGGGFSGTTTGGAFDNLNSGAREGFYGGLFTGANGEEVVGNVAVNHTLLGGDARLEVGAINAAQ